MIVADASPLIAFGRIKKLGLLFELLGTLVVPEEVLKECISDITKPGAHDIHLAHKDKIIQVMPGVLLEKICIFSNILDSGELHAISLAIQLNSGLLIDEKLGRSIAQKLNIKVIGTAGVILLAHRKKRIHSISSIVDELKSVGYYLSKGLIAELMKQSQE